VRTRQISVSKAIVEALTEEMQRDESIFIIGEDLVSHGGIFNQFKGLPALFKDRIIDTPISETSIVGCGVGAALTGMRPIVDMHFADFVTTAMDEIVNQMAKIRYMFGGQAKVPMVLWAPDGGGISAAAQHSQSLESWFAHIPGLKVVAPTTPYDAKGLLIASIKDNNPVIFFEHRWLHNIVGDVPEGSYTIPLGKGKIVQEGTDVTIVTFSYMVLESLKAAEFLKGFGIHCEIIDLRSLRPLDTEIFITSVMKTGRLIVVDNDWKTGGIGAEIISTVAENALQSLKESPRRIGFPECPSPTSPALSAIYYPRAKDIVKVIMQVMKRDIRDDEIPQMHAGPLDIPDASFTGPF